MFDWDDQELENLIWGEDAEAADHIVPYPEDIENKDLLEFGNNGKQTLHEEDTNSKAVERLTSTYKLVSEGGTREKNDGVSASGIVMGPQLDLPSFASSQVNNNVIAMKTELDIGPDVSGNHEDNELGELVGNSWANIGSFDDLDRIFSNDELDGPTSLGNADALWPSSKELISGAAKSSSTVLGSTSWEFGDLENSSSLIEPNSKYLDNEYPSVASSCVKSGICSSYSRHYCGRRVEQQKYTVGISPLIEEKCKQTTAVSLTGKTAKSSRVHADFVAPPNYSADKIQDDWSKNQPKHGQILDGVNNSRLSGDIYDTWPSSATNIPEYDPGCAPATVKAFPAPVHSQERRPNKSRPIAYQPFAKTCAAPYAYRNFPQKYPATKMARPTDILSGSEASQGDVTTASPLKMTPQEKIEKLRRRQQMRAMLAIQKQQQQLDHREGLLMHLEKPDLEDDECLTTLPCHDPGSPNKMDDLSTISDLDESPVEDTVLYHLQNVIARLDVKIRLCIKDSLYRLAQSATERHFANDMSSSNRSDAYDPYVAKEDTSSHHRTSGNANAETETNQIDRAVAHLLFHRPFKLAFKQAERPESSTSNRLSVEQETAGSRLPSGLLSKSLEKDFVISPSGSKRPFVATHHEDLPTNLSETEMKANPQMEQVMEHTD